MENYPLIMPVTEKIWKISLNYPCYRRVTGIIFPKKTLLCRDRSFEPSQRDGAIDGSQHISSLKNKKKCLNYSHYPPPPPPPLIWSSDIARGIFISLQISMPGKRIFACLHTKMKIQSFSGSWQKYNRLMPCD